MAQTARISIESDRIIHEMVSMTGKTRIEIIEEALDAYKHQKRMELFNDAYAKLKLNKKAWKGELRERVELDAMIEDGLKDE